MVQKIVVMIVSLELIFDFLEMVFPIKSMNDSVKSFSKLCLLMLVVKMILSYF